MDLLAFLTVFALAAAPSGAAATGPSPDSPAALARGSLQSQLAAAKKECREHPASVEAFARLAAAELREYRFTHAAETIAAAQAAVDRALALHSRDFEARRFQASIRLTNHEFS